MVADGFCSIKTVLENEVLQQGFFKLATFCRLKSCFVMRREGRPQGITHGRHLVEGVGFETFVEQLPGGFTIFLTR
ncbi:MAG: hypothetical protein CMJ81_06890 [Planctomycetaceae bacterium]|nr:hypothetical protein [Planctomycetaceae bacterium]